MAKLAEIKVGDKLTKVLKATSKVYEVTAVNTDSVDAIVESTLEEVTLSASQFKTMKHTPKV